MDKRKKLSDEKGHILPRQRVFSQVVQPFDLGPEPFGSKMDQNPIIFHFSLARRVATRLKTEVLGVWMSGFWTGTVPENVHLFRH